MGGCSVLFYDFLRATVFCHVCVFFVICGYFGAPAEKWKPGGIMEFLVIEEDLLEG